MMDSERYVVNGGLAVAVGSGYDAYLRGDPWETEWNPGGRRAPMFWHAAAKYLNGIPHYGNLHAATPGGGRP